MIAGEYSELGWARELLPNGLIPYMQNNDPTALSEVGIWGAHQYSGVAAYQTVSQPLWENRKSSSFLKAFDGSIPAMR